MKEEIKILSEEVKAIQHEYENFIIELERSFEKLSIEGNDLLNELKSEVAKSESIIYSLGDKLKKGMEIAEKITSIDNKVLAKEILLILKDTCYDFKDFAISHNTLIKAKAQMILSKNTDYMNTIQRAIGIQSKIIEKYQLRLDLQNRINEEKERLSKT